MEMDETGRKLFLTTMIYFGKSDTPKRVPKLIKATHSKIHKILNSKKMSQKS